MRGKNMVSFDPPRGLVTGMLLRVARGLDLVAERPEQVLDRVPAPRHGTAASATFSGIGVSANSCRRGRSSPCRKRRHCDREQRGGDVVGAVVDVVGERRARGRGPASAGHCRAAGGGGAALGRSFPVEDAGAAEGELEGLRAGRVLVQQVAEVGRVQLCW